MTTPPPASTPGLRAVRASLTSLTLRSPGPGHLALQTASRPDFYEGNALHVDGVVPPEELPRWWRAFDERLGHLPGVRHRRIAWESDDSLPGVAEYAARTAAAATALGASLVRLTGMELATLRPMVPLTEGIEVVRASRDAHWWGVRGLRISGSPGIPSDFLTWRTDEHRELATSGRGATWLAYRFGIPVATVTLCRDGDGIASVDDVVTHAVHRRLGIASHLVAVACASHRENFPDDRILLHAGHGSDAERLYARLGFGFLSTVWMVTATP